MAKLDSIFSWWDKQLLKDNSDVPDFQAYLLEHWYTDASLCNDDLKGHDQQVASHLREVCNNHGFLLFLANLETRITGGCGGDDGDWDEYGGYGGDSDDFHTITDICDENTTLQKVVELDGALVARNLYFEVENLLQKEDFRDEDPDEEEDYSGFTGNEGVSATHLYRRTVGILYYHDLC
jgi:hypothetical protein